MGNGSRLMWNDMTEPVLLEEYAGVPVPAPRSDQPHDVSESVTVTGTRPPGEGNDWEVRAYFTNPLNLGGHSAPLPAAHTGFKVYRGGQFQYSLDGGPTQDGTDLGKLRFQGTEQELATDKRGIRTLGEVKITPPKGVSGEMFAKQMARAAQDYDGSHPYALPPFSHRMNPFYSPEPPFPALANSMAEGTYNSNSFAAGLLGRVGAASNIPVIQRHLSNKWAAPGLEQPLPERYFRNR